MLMLSRKIGEKIHLYHNGELLATIQVVDVRVNKFRIGIEAPRSVEILRHEIVDRYLEKRVMPAADPSDVKGIQTDGVTSDEF